VQALLDAGADVVVLDARRFDEYHTMTHSRQHQRAGRRTGIARARARARTGHAVIVNCAGRTRSIIGTQSLVNAGMPNPVAALRNGTIGWTLAAQRWSTASRAASARPDDKRQQAAQQRRARWPTAPACGASRGSARALRADTGRTVYFFDVRTPEEYAAGHLPGSAARRAASWCRKPSSSRRCAARASCWPTATACAPT
jgi:rhodanese-related sulfurtransferase